MYSSDHRLSHIQDLLRNRELTEEVYQKTLRIACSVEPQLGLFHQFEDCLLALDACCQRTWALDSRYLKDIQVLVEPWARMAIDLEFKGLIDHRKCLFIRGATRTTHFLAQPCHTNQQGLSAHILNTIRERHSTGSAFVLPAALIDWQKLKFTPCEESDQLLFRAAANSLASAFKEALGRPLFEHCILAKRDCLSKTRL